MPAHLGAGFDSLRDRLAALPTERCSEDQRDTAERLAALTGRIAETARAIGDVRAAMEQQSALQTNRRFVELMAMVEEFDHRRHRLIDHLRQMDERAR